jgi:hypothetical protein
VTATAEPETRTDTDADTTAVDTEAGSTSGARRGRSRRWAIGLTIAGLVIGALIMLWPALAAPLNADQRYMYMNVPGRVQGDWLDIVRILWSEIPERAEQGRVTPVGYLMAWIFYNGITELSVATGTPVVVLHGIQKVLLLGAAVLCVAAFVKSLRGRGSDGQLVAPSRSTVWLVVAGVVVLGAAGTQTHLQFRNGWVSYPVLTYTAVIVCFGVPALTLWLTRRIIERPSAWRISIAVISMVLVGVFLNLSYELYFVAFPAAVLALLLQPDPPDRRRPALVAKLITGGTLSVAFLATLAAIRVWTADACADHCYVGTQLQLSSATPRIVAYNVLSTLPLSGRDDALRSLEKVGIDSLPLPFSSPLVIGCVLAGAALVAARILLLRGSNTATGADGSTSEPGDLRRGETGALFRGGVVAFAIAAGAPLIMSISAQAPEIIRGVGNPYRHIVVMWVALCLAGLLCLIAVDLRIQNRLGVLFWTVTAGVAVLVAGIMLPINLQTTRAEAALPTVRVAEDVYRELTLGDPAPEADERRCATIAALRENRVVPQAERNITNSAQWAYRHFYGVDYCTEIDTPAP